MSPSADSSGPEQAGAVLRRIALLLALPDDAMDGEEWQDEVREIGRLDDGGRSGG